MTTSAVMSLVIEAMGTATSGWREYSTEECVASRTRAALERRAGAAGEARPAYFRCTGNAVPPDTAAWEAAATSSSPANAVVRKPLWLIKAAPPIPKLRVYQSIPYVRHA